MFLSEKFDVIVVGGGHAGIEACWASARMGASTAMVTMEREAVGRMSCNPAIGGLGKGQMVREIDALGGLMGEVADASGIQFRLLNRSKGPAVWAPRAQSDRDVYPREAQARLFALSQLTVFEGLVDRLDVDGGRVRGVRLVDGRRLRAEAVILTTGTFLRGLMHCGGDRREGGRVGEQSAAGLSGCLADLGFSLGRLKTGTPPRVDRDTVDYSRCEPQPGDPVPMPFSYMTDVITMPQIMCHVTWTHEGTHELIRANLHRAPMYTGQIESTGPRYCPSIEDKVVRFSDKSRHQVFLEPEGLESERVYCNGISTSLPKDVQEAMLSGIVGLERARIVQPGYAVEYDYVPTHQTHKSLESKPVRRLFLAGQINGTSGYEEAAGQGLVAGINAARAVAGEDPIELGRDQAYIGVMVDDLMTRPPSEPYRMFTSRAEYRLLLRADNADARLTPLGRRLGLVDDPRFACYERKRRAMSTVEALSSELKVEGVKLSAWLRRPEATLDGLAEALSGRVKGPVCTDALWQVLVNGKYAGYVRRQDDQIARFRRLESMRIPSWLDYGLMGELRREAREQLTRVGPKTLGQASRISGVSPADLTILWIYATGRRAVSTSEK